MEVTSDATVAAAGVELDFDFGWILAEIAEVVDDSIYFADVTNLDSGMTKRECPLSYVSATDLLLYFE